MPASDFQQNRNKRLALLLAGLCGAILLMLWYRGINNSFSVDPGIYRYGDLKSVNRVLLESPSGTTDLVVQGSRWVVNNSFPADRGLIEVLFATLQQAEPKRPVATSIQDSVAAAVRANGVKVQLYSGGGPVKTFYAGGNSEKTQAYFVLPEEAEAHLMAIPGYRVYVSGIFELSALGWREKLVFDFNWRNFKNLRASFRNPKGDFSVGLDGNIAVLENAAEADTARLNTFLDQISMLSVEDYLETPPSGDSSRISQPFVTFSIADIGGRTFSLEVFELQGKFYGRLNNQVWATLDERKVLPLLRPKEFFAKE